jgi:hypothetical protein
MKKILTPEQYQKWDADRKAKMEKRKEMMKDRAGKDGFGKRKMMNKPAEAPVVVINSNFNTLILSRKFFLLFL